MITRESSAEIDAIAAEWAVRSDHAPLADHEQAELDAWLAADIRRLGAFVRASAIYTHARRAKALGPDFDPEAYAAQSQPGEPDDPDQPTASQIDAVPTRRRVLTWGGVAVAASALAAIGLGVSSRGAYATKRGEIRLIPLSDGSQMTLNTGTQTRVRFSENEREIELAEGEALFDVAKDPARPFTVIAGDTQVRAVGTSFSVQRLPGQPVRVIVREGVVEVLRPSRPASSPRRVEANNRVISNPEAAIKTAALAPAEVGRALAWREGMLSFEDQPLAQAIEEFARYSDQRITLSDPELGRETITGLYAANNAQGFARSAALSLGLQAESTPDGIMLRREMK